MWQVRKQNTPFPTLCPSFLPQQVKTSWLTPYNTQNQCKWGEICNKGQCKDYGTCQGAQSCPGGGKPAQSCGGGPRSSCQWGECRMCADGVGRCAPRSATPSCWQQQQNRQKCNQNWDCPGGFCVKNCCGNFCYYPDKGDICDLNSSPYKLFRK